MSAGAGISGSAARDLYLDTEQIRDVEGFYRRLSLVTAAAATDLRGHDFGAWTHGADVDHADLRERYRAMAVLLADRLDADAARAGHLADGFGTALAAVSVADEHAAHVDAEHSADTAGGSAEDLA